MYAYDRLGFGRFSAQSQPADASFIEVEAREQLPALIQALGLKQYLLMGHSVGGGMALAAASMAGAACVGVISESAQAFVEEQTRIGIRQAEQAFTQAPQFAKLEKWHAERTRWVLDAWIRVWLSEAFNDWSLAPYLPNVQCPVLALHGDLDEFGSEAFPQRICQGVSGPANLVLLPQCGHVPHREQPALVLDKILQFLQQYQPA